MQQGKSGVGSTACPSCGGEIDRGLSECPHCGSMTPLRISLDPKALGKWLVRIVMLAAIGFAVKLLLMS
jgi:uncharacterized protein (UPF0212 family)